MIRELNIGIKLTKTAINQIVKLFKIEDNHEYSFKMTDKFIDIFEEGYYDFYLQNATREVSEGTTVRLLMAGDTDNENNLNFISVHENKILSLEGVNVDDKSFFIINVRLLPKNVGSKSNKSIFSKIEFYSGNSIRSSAIPDDLMLELAELPNAKELYKKVDKNIRDWDNYLSIIEENAYNSQLEIEYIGYKQEDVLTHCIFSFNKFNSNQIEKLKRFRNERVILFYSRGKDEITYGIEGELEEFEDTIGEDTCVDFEECIGTIDKINFKNNTIKVELEPEFQEMALDGKLDFPQVGNLRISKMGDLAQARNLRRGLNLLRTGKAHNPDLDIILFDPERLEENVENHNVLNESDLLLKTLNTNQKLAVEGVLNAKDLFLIQGPPGTGKTTVIAEICYQNAIRGMKTLIASQSNLAVDNALSRLMYNPKIRVLRKGNLSRVEQEGEKYTENNVVDTWLGKTADSCKKKFEEQQDLLNRINNLENELEEIVLLYEKKDEINYNKYEISNNIQSINIESQKIINMKDKLNIFFRDVEKKIWKNKNICVLSNIFILSLLSAMENSLETSKFKALLKESGYLDNYDPYHKLKLLFNEIESCVEDNKMKQDYKKDVLYRIELLNRVKNTAKTHVISDIEKELQRLLQLDEFNNSKIAEFMELLKIDEANKLKVTNKINILNKLREKLEHSSNLLTKLKKVYNINDVAVVDNELNNEITKKIIDDFEKQAVDLYNNKPNKLILLLGFKKKWKIDIINNLHIANKYRKYINLRLSDLNIQNDECNEKLKSRRDELTTIITRFKVEENKKLEIVENEISSNTFKILDLKDEYDHNKNLIISLIEKQQLKLHNNLIILNTKLKDKEQEINIIIEKIENFNARINEIVDTRLSLNKISKKKDIKEYYKKLLEPQKVITANYVDIVGEWINRIRQKKYGNKSELKDLYINAANVIGITCVQSGNKDFTNKYPDFDVVIVDEVSKATPPELVLPMLKGKKLVLVGDHKQLPPMIGSETFEELKELNNREVAVDSESDDLEYMKKSLFEELYINVAKSNKIMLNTQYRMHSSIMNTINQFYVDSENNGLICGVEKEEVVKNHKLRTRYFDENNNLIWVDIPLHEKFYEKVNAHNSFYNETEVEVIDKILKDINESCKTLGVKKEVAVITFYSAQAKLLQRELVSKNKYNNLKLRVGTVDRFQGIEREIVIVSFVRNNNKRNVGFAKDPKRINVALSRAQNLLIIVGCSELFCEKNFHKKAREIYQNVLKVVDSYNGIRDAKEIFN